MLFALRYERDGRSEISSLIQRCQDFGMSLSQLGVVRTILLQAGADKCAPARMPVMTLMRGVSTVALQHSTAGNAEQVIVNRLLSMLAAMQRLDRSEN
jgi:hypothetical protein